MIRNEILNVVTSKAPKVASRPVGGLGAWGAVSAPAGNGAKSRRKKL